MKQQSSQKLLWLSFHIFYDEERRGRDTFPMAHLLYGLVGPLVSVLLADGKIDRFFFLRYALGGHHVRLRLRCKASHGSAITKQVHTAADEYLRNHPATGNSSREWIQQVNKALLASDPNETDSSISATNSCVARPFEPELKRYGGAEHLDASLDFFSFTSCLAMTFLDRKREAAGSIRLSHGFSCLGRLSLGFASSPENWLSLVRYARSTQDTESHLEVAGDREFKKSSNGLIRIFQREIERLRESLAESWGDVASARRLRDALPSEKRRSVISSQLHMTANRLGIGNAEEIYLCRLMWRAATELMADCSARAELESGLHLRAAEPEVDLEDHLRTEMIPYLGKT